VLGAAALMPNDFALERRIIDSIYSGACDSAELEQAVELIAQYFDSAGALLGELDSARPDAQFMTGVRTIDHAFVADYQAVAELDPAPRLFAALPTGTATTTDRLFSDHVLRTDVFRNEFLRPRGVDAALCGPLLSEGGRFALVAVHHPINREGFGDDDIARLERLMPHLTRALQIRRLFLQSELRGRVLESIVDRIHTGLIGVSHEGPILFVNNAVRAIAAARDGIGLDRQGRLVAADRAAAKRLSMLEADVEHGGPGGLVRVQRPSQRAPYLVLVSPLPAGDKLLPNAHGGILFVVHDPGRLLGSATQRIARLLHLPLGAAKVVAAILEGVELKDYAERAGISTNTVKFHLKTAFERTETRSQTELVRRTLLALNDLGPYFSDG
jgi:GAF domain-containing protein